jgi:hypothetical protein
VSEALFIHKTDEEARDWENYIWRILKNSILHLILPFFDFVKSWKILTMNVARMWGNKKYIDVKHLGKFRHAAARYSSEGKIVVYYFKLIDYIYM